MLPTRTLTEETFEDQLSDIVLSGTMKKTKTNRIKYFLLRKESEQGPARLEYYPNEKKFKNGQLPRRTIYIRNCFNINHKPDSKYKHVIALYSRMECFTIAFDSKEMMEMWLSALLELQLGSIQDEEGEQRPVKFKHVWPVNIRNKGLGSSKNIHGAYHLCLTENAITFYKMSGEDIAPLEFPLQSIRKCGHSDMFFFLELGRSAVTGPGELWMQTEDCVIAQNVHEALLGSMKSRRDNNPEPLMRPVSMIQPSLERESTRLLSSSLPNAVHIPQRALSLSKEYMPMESPERDTYICMKPTSNPPSPSSSMQATNDYMNFPSFTEPDQAMATQDDYIPMTPAPSEPNYINCSPGFPTKGKT